MWIRAATPADVPQATECLVAAFSDDPVTGAFFGDSPMGRDPATARFFALMLDVGLALKMPVLVAQIDDKLVGVAKGDDAAPPDWPAEFQQRMQQLEALHPAFAARFATYDRIVSEAHLDMPQYHLSAVGVRPGFQGAGIGKALIQAYLDLSDRDPRSQGMRLETGRASNLGLYAKFGFQTRSTGPLDQITLWTMFCPKAAPQS